MQCEENNHSLFLNFPKICKKVEKKNYIPGIFWAFKSKLQIIPATTYIVPFLADTKNFFFCLNNAIYLYLFLLFSHFVFLFSPSLS